MAFIFEGLLGCSVTLAAIYFILAIYTYHRLQWLQSHSSKGLNTRKLFVMTLLLTSILRTMSFLSMALLDLEEVDYHIDSKPDNNKHLDDDGSKSDFFEKSTLVLFDFPDFAVLSAYVLLIIVWAEAYLKSRRHWLSSIRFRRVWMFTYFIFNIILYSSQIALYSLLFIPAINEYLELTLIYMTVSAFSLLIPFIWLIGYFYLAIVFSGFPFSTMAAKIRLKYLTHLGALWTFSRMIWAFLALTTVLQGWMTEARKSKLYYSIVLILIFLVAEVLPIVFSLKPHIIQSLSEDHFNPNFEHYLNTPGFGIFGGGSKQPSSAESQGEDQLAHLLEADQSSVSNKPRSNSQATLSTQSLTPASSAMISPYVGTTHYTRNPMQARNQFSPQPQPVAVNGQDRGGNNSRDSTVGDEEEYRDARQHSGISSSFGERNSYVTADSSHSERPSQAGDGFWKNVIGFFSS